MLAFDEHWEVFLCTTRLRIELCTFKQAFKIDEQIKQLKERGLIVHNDDRA